MAALGQASSENAKYHKRILPNPTASSAKNHIQKSQIKMGWLPPSPNCIAMCQDGGSLGPPSREDGGMYDTMIGIDLAKKCISASRGIDDGEVKFRKKIGRGQFLRFMGAQPPCVAVMESCGSAHFWARELVKFGHAVKLIAPQYVRPFVKRQKNDAADAEAIVAAAQRPENALCRTKDGSSASTSDLIPRTRAHRPPAHRTGQCFARRALRIRSCHSVGDQSYQAYRGHSR